MISFYKPKGESGPWEGYGMAADAKPTDATIPNGTLLYVMDTHLLYVYDKPTQTWVVQ